tara:strand:- start:1428 stop:1721 length:294 start_codon:yes stop_codon:yes gene_type:complete
MFLFKIFGIFGFMTGPLVAAIVGGIGLVKLYDVGKGLFFGGFTGTTADATRAGVFVSTVTAVTAVTGMNKVASKLRAAQRSVAAFGDRVDSTDKRDE